METSAAFKAGLDEWIRQIIAENALLLPTLGKICYVEDDKCRFMPMDHTLEAQTRKSYETRN